MKRVQSFADRVRVRVEKTANVVGIEPVTILALIIAFLQKLAEVCAQPKQGRMMKVKARAARRLNATGNDLRRQSVEMLSEVAAQNQVEVDPSAVRSIANCCIDEGCATDEEELNETIDEVLNYDVF